MGRGSIRGFASAGAVGPGGTVDLRVGVEPPQDFTVDVLRIGHYGGEGSAVISRGLRLPGLAQPSPLVAGRTVSCHHWWLSGRVPVPEDWDVGAYVAVLTTADGQHRTRIPFTVRDDRPADLLLVLPDLTWQAHNPFPGPYPEGEPATATATVSLDRPYPDPGLPRHVGHVHDVIRWAERYGYDLAYADATDLHAGRVDPARYRGLVFPGPDAYWTTALRRTVERARDQGVSLVFLAAGSAYWQVELHASPAGTPDRLLTCRRRKGPGGKPIPWREADGPGSGAGPGSGPEQQLLGIQYGGAVPRPHPLVVRNADHWLWEATGAYEGDEIAGLVDGHADRYFPRAPLPEHDSRVLLAHSPYRDADGTRRHQDTSLYRAPSGAWVFASGTFAWAPALDASGHVDARIQRATANLLDRICKRD